MPAPIALRMPDADRLPKPDSLPPPTTGQTWIAPPEYTDTGRLTVQSAAALARPYTAEAITTLVHVMRDPASPVEQRRGAANDLLSRAWGKPKETVELLETPEQQAIRGTLSGLSGADLLELLHAIRSAPPPVQATAEREDAREDRGGGESSAPPPDDSEGGADGPESASG